MRALLPVLRALRGADVSFVVVGGVAVLLQGHPRSTVDLDLVIDLESDNVERARLVRVEDVEVPVASRRDLITLKRAAGRPQDLADIEALEALDRLEEADGA